MANLKQSGIPLLPNEIASTSTWDKKCEVPSSTVIYVRNFSSNTEISSDREFISIFFSTLQWKVEEEILNDITSNNNITSLSDKSPWLRRNCCICNYSATVHRARWGNLVKRAVPCGQNIFRCW